MAVSCFHSKPCPTPDECEEFAKISEENVEGVKRAYLRLLDIDPNTMEFKGDWGGLESDGKQA